MISYKFDTDTKILSVIFAGEVSLTDIFTYLEKIFQDEDLPEKLKILYDLRKADLNIDLEEIKKLNEFSLRTSEHFEKVYSAFLTNQPNQTALSLMFTIKNPYENLHRDVFTTKDVAMEWLEEANV